MKKWKILSKLKTQSIRQAQDKNSKLKTEDVVDVVLKNRGIKTKSEREEFLHPRLNQVTSENVGIDKEQLRKSLRRIQKALDRKEKIIIFGDYDVDGICGSAILWESLRDLGADVMPYIPHRIDEGYGLSTKGIENVRNIYPKGKLVITVDNGIVAHKAVRYAKELGFDVIITDHHVPSTTLPKALAIVHTTALCGSGVAFLLSQEISNLKSQISNKSKIQNNKLETHNSHLELVALATIADLVPLKGANRVLVKYGLDALQSTKRIGILELCKEAAIDPKTIGVYEVGHIIGPRLNAMGRMEYAMDSLRLLCTSNKEKAKKLAEKLGSTNKERKEITQETVSHAIAAINHQPSAIKKLLFVVHENYQQGVIGLVAGKLVEEFYRPAIVVAKGEKFSKASARSVSGFNIIEFIRKSSDLLVDAGGHPMAAGFTVETENLRLLEDRLLLLAEKMVDEEILTRKIRIDCELPLWVIDNNLYQQIQRLAPFGMGNPEPVFVTKGVIIEDMRVVGYGRKHLKFQLSQQLATGHQIPIMFDAIAFGMGEKASELHVGDKVDIVYIIDEDRWLARRSLGEGGNGNKKLQLKIKDLKRD